MGSLKEPATTNPIFINLIIYGEAKALKEISHIFQTEGQQVQGLEAREKA